MLAQWVGGGMEIGEEHWLRSPFPDLSAGASRHSGWALLLAIALAVKAAT